MLLGDFNIDLLKFETQKKNYFINDIFSHGLIFDFIECFTTTFLRHIFSWTFATNNKTYSYYPPLCHINVSYIYQQIILYIQIRNYYH